MNYNYLINLNRTALFKKLDDVYREDTMMAANDLIEVLSKMPERDKKLINDYSPEEIVVQLAKDKVPQRRIRFFTEIGISRYIHEGKISDYKNACMYFKLEPIDLEMEQFKKEFAEINCENIKTSIALKWLYEKRKTSKELGQFCTIDQLIFYTQEHEGANKKKLTILSSFG